MNMEAAQHYAERGQWAQFVSQIDGLIQSCTSIDDWLDIGTLLFNAGFLSRARQCYQSALQLEPHEPRMLASLANLARDAGERGEARRLYTDPLRHRQVQPRRV